jgi:site-specific recombinase XerD
LLTLAYATGMCRNELLHIWLKDIDRQRSVIKITGRGNKQREPPVPDGLFKSLEMYYRMWRPSVYLFEGPVPGKAYSASSMQKIIKDNAIKVGIKRTSLPMCSGTRFPHTCSNVASTSNGCNYCWGIIPDYPYREMLAAHRSKVI